MDKNAIKKYAVWARRELISRVSQRALQYGITETGIVDASADSINGRLLTAEEKSQRAALIKQVRENGYEQVMEEVAYTWFNRFCALRFMEVNGYLPSHIRVFSDDENNFKPQILTEAINLDLSGLNLEQVYKLKSENKTEELYKYLLIVQCNALNSILPAMFQRISDYTELLFPDNLLREGSVVEQLVTQISADNFDVKSESGQVEIIGWLYQYYISEKHEEVVNPLYGKALSKDDIPAATQLFTPDWIVRYMVENSLGKLWIEGHPDDNIKTKWKYYLNADRQGTQAIEIRKKYATLEPQNIKCIDPCMGSGHILVYMFDVLMQIYESAGYSTRDAVTSIISNNLYGLDIDERAMQLAYFAVMMKACAYDSRFLNRGIQPNIYSIVESNGVNAELLEYFSKGNGKLKNDILSVMDDMYDAKEYGSIIRIRQIDFEAIYQRFDEIEKDSNINSYLVLRDILPIVKVAEVLSRKYHIVATNPPYLNNMKGKLKSRILRDYKDYSGDLFSVFIVRNTMLMDKIGFSAYMSPNVWMFIKSFEKLRDYIIKNYNISSFLQIAKGAFFKEATVDICSFVLSNSYWDEGVYVRLEDYKGDMETQKRAFLNTEKLNSDHNIYIRNTKQFERIPGHPIAFWISDKMLSTFNRENIGQFTIAKAGIVSGNDNLFLRHWYEVAIDDITFNATNFDDKTAYKWVPLNKGGAYRKYYGNGDYIINIYDIWNSDKVNESVRRSEPEYYFKQAMTWSYVTTGKASFRITENATSGTAAPNLFFNSDSELYYTLAFTNSCISQTYLDILNPTINLNVTNVSTLPFIFSKSFAEKIITYCRDNISISKADWDFFETSWDFKKHPLLQHSISKVVLDESKLGKHWLLKNDFKMWEALCEQRFNQFKANEEELNRIFIEIYGLQGELTPEVEDRDVTVRKADLQREIKSLISYAVGCMFGRYSIYEDGLICAGGKFDFNSYIDRAYVAKGRPDVKEFYHEIHFTPDIDNIIPICDDEYFADDIVGKFVEFIEIVYGSATLEENLRFIANALGGKGHPRDVIRDYFLNGFYADHIKIYQKRPIYWLFDSGKKNGFKALVYMHRYKPDTLARMRTDYVHEQQARYRTAIEDCNQRLLNANGSERVKLSKKLQTLTAQADEIVQFEEKVHHLADMMISIDLDDGVKHNYEKFKDILAPIK